MPLKVGTADFFKRPVSPFQEGVGRVKFRFSQRPFRLLSSKLLRSQSPKLITRPRTLAAAAPRLQQNLLVATPTPLQQNNQNAHFKNFSRTLSALTLPFCLSRVNFLFRQLRALRRHKLAGRAGRPVGRFTFTRSGAAAQQELGGRTTFLSPVSAWL